MTRAMGAGERFALARVLVVAPLITGLAVVAPVGNGSKVPDVAAESAGDGPAGALVPLVPRRLLETRDAPGATTVDGLFEGVGRVTGGSVVEFTVAGRGGVPIDADAALVNVAAVLPDAPGFLTVWACSDERPQPASHVNFAPGAVYPNAVLAGIGTDGKVCVFASAGTDVLADVNAYVPSGGSLVPVAPARLLETRDDPIATTVDGQFRGGGPVAAGETVEVQIAGRGGVPADASAVLLNVTAVVPAAPGFFTVYPCDQPRPEPASNVNYFAGGVYPNAVPAKLSADGRVCIYSLAASHVLVDIAGFVEFGANLVTSKPLRMLETRVGPNAVTFDGQFAGAGALGAGESVTVQIAGRGGVPHAATAAVMNVAAVFPERNGFLTVYACDQPRPEPASNVNYFAGGVYPNAVVTQLSSEGTACIYSSAPTDVIADVVGALGSGGTGLDLSAIGIAESTAEPFDRLAVTGLDPADDISEFGVDLHLPDGDRAPLFVYADADGPFVRAPLNPVDPTAPGQIQLSIVDGDRVGHTATIELLALPAAPGAWDELFDTLAADLAAKATAEGSSINAVRAADFDDLPPALAVLKLFDQMLSDGTQVPTSAADLPADGRALLESIVAKTGLADAISNASAAGTAEGFESFGGGLGSARLTESSTGSGATTAEFSSGRFVESAAASCRTPDPGIHDLQTLIQALDDGVEARRDAHGVQAKLFQDATVFFGDIAGWVAMVLPKPYDEIVNVGGKVVTTALSFVSLYDQVKALTYPDDLSLDIEGTAEFNEDFEQPGTLTTVAVTASTPGGSLQQLVEGLASLFVGEVIGALQGKLKNDLAAANEAFTQTPDLDPDANVGASGPLMEQFVNRAAGKWVGDITKYALAEIGAVDGVCPKSWTEPVPLDDQYFTLEPGDAGAQVDGFVYEPTEVGSSWVRADLESSAFAGFNASDIQEFETKQLSVGVTPSIVKITNPGETFTLRATIQNADDTTLWWTDPHGLDHNTNGSAEITFTSPTTLDSYEYDITIESGSRTGLFEGKDDGVYTIASIQLSDVIVLPNGEVLEPGDMLQFVAKDASGDSIDVNWSATGGHIDSDGWYTADDTPGDFTVTAAMTSDPSRVGTASVTIEVPTVCDLYGTWDLDIIRYLSDYDFWWEQNFPGTGGSSSLIGGVEQVTFTPAGPGEFYGTYELSVDHTTMYDNPESTIVTETLGTDTGSFDTIFDDTRLAFYDAVDTIESQSTYTDKTSGNVVVGPLQPADPISLVGDPAPVDFSCDENELMIEGLGVPTYWSRLP